MRIRFVLIAASVPGVARRLRTLVLPLLLMIPAILPSGNDLMTLASDAGKFPVGVLSSKGNLQLDGRVDWGHSRRSVLPMIYDGTRIHLKNGSAALELLMGGNLRLCQDADLTVQQHRSPFLFTLQRGTIAFDLPQTHGDVFLTPDFLIKIEPGPELQPKHFRGEISLEPDGTVCVRSHDGLLIITAQDNSGTVTVPAGAGLRIPPGQINFPERFQDCSCGHPISSREKDGLISAYGTGGSSQKPLWKSFLRKLIKILTLGIV